MSSTKTPIPHPYRSLLFVLTIGGVLAAIVLGVVAMNVPMEATAAASLWVWAGHALTFGIVAFVGELVVAGVTWRAPKPGPSAAPDPGE